MTLDFVCYSVRDAKRLLFLGIIVCVHGCIPTEMGSADNEKNDSTVISPPVSAPDEYEAISLLGSKLVPPPLSEKSALVLNTNLEKAKADFQAYPDSLELVVWYGRRLAYLSKYKESIEVYTDGLRKFPDSYQLYRHRGHRYITIRQFDDAILDLEKAAFYMREVELKIEPDGIPNKLNVPLSSTQFNVWYHLGLAYYLKGNYDKAISAYKKCMEVSTNDDLLVATTDWMYMTYRKLGNVREAQKLLSAIRPKMNIVENDSYHKRLLMYKGLVNPASLLNVKDDEDGLQIATQGYGVANWHLMNGEEKKGREILERIVQGPNWAAFGYIAAEAELFKLKTL